MFVDMINHQTKTTETIAKIVNVKHIERIPSNDIEIIQKDILSGNNVDRIKEDICNIVKKSLTNNNVQYGIPDQFPEKYRSVYSIEADKEGFTNDVYEIKIRTEPTKQAFSNKNSLKQESTNNNNKTSKQEFSNKSLTQESTNNETSKKELSFTQKIYEKPPKCPVWYKLPVYINLQELRHMTKDCEFRDVCD